MKNRELENILDEIKERGLDDLSPARRHSANIFDELLRDGELQRRVAKNFRADRADTSRAWSAARRRIEAERRREARKLFGRGYMMRYALGGAAAALAVVFAAAALLDLPAWRTAGEDMTLALPSDYGRMTLTDDGGRVIELGEAGAVIIDRQGIVAEWKDGLLAFRAKDPRADFYRVTVPCGKTMRVALTDGSVVRLNSLSSFRFPAVFDSERRVEMLGQAFFEVAGRNNNPFVVSAGEVGVRVTGTRFDVAAYPGESEVNVTLVEGSVEVNTGRWPAVTLAPGEQAGYSPASGDLSLRRVDTGIVTGWADGLLVFEDRPLGEIMTSLSRSYDIEPVFEDDAAREVLFGFKLPRYPDIDPIIELFREIAQVEISREGRRIIFRSKQ